MTMEPEENWDKDDKESRQYIPDSFVIPEENWDDDPSLPKPFVPNDKDRLLYDENFADIGAQGGTYSSESLVFGQNGETNSTGNSSDNQTLVVGKYHHRKLKARFSYAYEDKKVYVTNVGFKTPQKVLWDFFEKFGKVKHCRLLLDRFGHSSGRAVVIFCDESGSKAAVESSEDELELHGRMLHVTPYRRKIFEPMKSSMETEKLEEETGTETFDGKDVEDVTPVDESHVQLDGSSPDRSQVITDNKVSACTSTDSPIDHLNDEMLAHIFEYLSLQERLLAERVCKRWRLLSLQFWSSIKQLRINSGMFKQRCFMDRDLKQLLERGSSSLYSLDLSRSSGMLTDRSLNAIAKYCKNLRELNLSGMNISNKGLQTLAEKCHQLEVIKIQDSCQRVGEKGLWWLFHRCKKLKQVNLNGIRGLKGQCLHVLCEDVLCLDLGNCAKLLDVGIQKVHDKCPRILELSVANCCKLTDAAFKLIGQCAAIKSLDISRIGPNVTTSGLMALSHLTHLEQLTAADCLAFEDSVLTAISSGCRHLRSLNIDNVSFSTWVSEDRITDAGVDSLANNCPLLSSVNLGCRPQISDSSLRSLSQSDHLKELVIKKSSHLTDSGVMCVLSGCPVLQTLDLTGCVFVGDSTVLAAVSRMKDDLSRTLYLAVGETSVDPSAIPTDLANLKISCYSPDDYDDMACDCGFDDEDDELNYDFSQVSTGLSDHDDYLDNDDPLAEERWHYIS